MRTSSCVWACFLVLILSGIAAAIDVEVKQDGTGVGGYTTIEAGIFAAKGGYSGTDSGTVTILDSSTYIVANNGYAGDGWAVNVVPATGETPIIQCDANNGGWYNIVFAMFGNNCTLNFDRIKFVGNGATAAVCVGLGGNSNSSTISNCWITGNFGIAAFEVGFTGDKTGSSMNLSKCRAFLTSHCGFVRVVHTAAVVTIDQCSIVQDPAAVDIGGSPWDLRAFFTSWQLGASFNVTNTIIDDSGGKLTLGISAHELGTGNAYTSNLDYCVYTSGMDTTEDTITNSAAGDANLIDPANGDFTIPTAVPGSIACSAGNGIGGAINAGWDQNPSCTVSVYNWRRY